MNWGKKNYRIATKNGEEQSYYGHTNGLFAHNFVCTLTHLKSGLKIADFNREEDVRRVGDYLSDTYRAEFEAFNKAIKRTMTPEQIHALPEARSLIELLKSDEYLRQQIAEFGRKQEENNGKQD